jgi:hypothetical protein
MPEMSGNKKPKTFLTQKKTWPIMKIFLFTDKNFYFVDYKFKLKMKIVKIDI